MGYRIVDIGKVNWCVVIVSGVTWWSLLVEIQLDDRYPDCIVLCFNQGCVDVISEIDASPYSESFVLPCRNWSAVGAGSLVAQDRTSWLRPSCRSSMSARNERTGEGTNN